MARVLRKEYTAAILNNLRENGVRKPVHIPKYTFHITDDEGNHADFDVKRIDKTAMYTKEDVTNILTAFFDCVTEALQHGDEVFVNGFGSFAMDWRKEHWTYHPVTKEKVTIPAHYVPSFKPGEMVRSAVKLYNAALQDGTATDWRSDEQRESGTFDVDAEDDE